MGVKYHMIKNIMIASAGSVFYYQSITNITQWKTLLGTVGMFVTILILLNDADKNLLRKKHRRECHEKKMSA